MNYDKNVKKEKNMSIKCFRVGQFANTLSKLSQVDMTSVAPKSQYEYV